MLESDFKIYREHNDISYQIFFHSLDDASYRVILHEYLFSFSLRIIFRGTQNT